MYDVKSQKIIGTVDPKGGQWSIPFEYDPDDAELLSTRGRLYIVVDFEASENIDLHLASKIIIDEVKEKYYGDLEGTPLQSLETALVSGKNKLLKMAESGKEDVSDLTFDIAACVVWGRVIYLAQVGNTSCLIIRNGEIVNISNKTSGEVMTSSGLLENDDVVIIGTKEFESTVDNSNLISSLSNLENIFKTSSNSEALSSVIIRFKKTIVPSKKDISNLVSSFKFGSSDKTKESDEEINKKEDSSNETKQEAIQSLNGDLSDKEETKENKKSKRGRKPKKLMLGGILSLLLLASLVGGYYYYNNFYTNISEPTVAVVDIEQFVTRFDDLNNFNADRNDYLVLLTDINQSLENNPESAELLSIKQEVEDRVDTIRNTEDSENLLVDLTQKYPNANVNKIDVVDDKSLLISDPGSGQAYIYNAEDNSFEDIAVEEGYLISRYVDNTFYVLTNTSLYSGSTIEGLSSSSVAVSGSSINDLEVYFDNIYALSDSAIYKYASGSYEESIWAELEGSGRSLAIDGDIYVSSGSTVYKYYTGEQQDFNVSDLEEKLEEAVLLKTERGDNTLYIADNNALYSVNKDTLDHEEIINYSDHNINPASFALFENTLYISTSSSIYSFEIE